MSKTGKVGEITTAQFIDYITQISQWLQTNYQTDQDVLSWTLNNAGSVQNIQEVIDALRALDIELNETIKADGKHYIDIDCANLKTVLEQNGYSSETFNAVMSSILNNTNSNYVFTVNGLSDAEGSLSGIVGLYAEIKDSTITFRVKDFATRSMREIRKYADEICDNPYKIRFEIKTPSLIVNGLKSLLPASSQTRTQDNNRNIARALGGGSKSPQHNVLVGELGQEMVGLWPLFI